MRRRSFLRLAAAGSACSAASYIPFTSTAQAAIPGTVTWGGAYLLDDQTAEMPHTRDSTVDEQQQQSNRPERQFSNT